MKLFEMYRKAYTYAAAGLVALAGFICMTGCSEDNAGQSAALSSHVIIASNDVTQTQTKTCIETSIDGNTKYVAVLWTPEDELGVFTDKEQNVKYTKADREKNEEVAAFVTSENISGTPQYVYYPYSKNAGTDVTSLSGNVPSVQTMDTQKKTLPGDCKVGVFKEATANGAEFKFTHLFSPVRIVITGANTTVANDVLESIELSVTRGDNNSSVYVCGNFKFNATAPENYTIGTSKSNKITFDWSSETKLGTEAQAYGTIFPQIKKGDKMHFVVRTSDHTATFTAIAKVDFKANTLYTFPLTLSRFESNPSEYGYVVEERVSPKITEFKFEVAVKGNTGKLLNNELKWNSSSHTPAFSSVTEHKAKIEGNEITLTIPYLYDFKLVPTFTAPGCTVSANGQTLVSGETVVDFTNPVTFTVSSDEESRDYLVKVTNTGLPVVVLKQSGTDFEKEYVGGLWGSSIGGTLVNEFVGIRICGKNGDWATTDEITIYNSNGTLNLPTSLCGAKLRGNTSREYPKKPFAVKLVSKQSVLGMPAHKRWVLLANWLDHSMIRNAVAFDIAHAVEEAWKTGQIEQGIPWNVHGQNVELIFVESDGKSHHVGNYYLCEQIKIDENRLNIKASYEDFKGDNPTLENCGYLLEFDSKDDDDPYFNTSNGIKVKFKDDEIEDTDLFTEVQNKVQSIEDNLDNKEYAAAYEKLDINSMIDQFLIWELTMNREYGDPGSVYMFMNGNGKLSAGPVWDFDRGTFQNQEKAKDLGNSDSYRIKPDDAWMFQRSQETYIWYKQLAKDETFKKTVVKRWEVIKPYLEKVLDQINAYGQSQASSYQYNSVMWPTNKEDIRKYKDDFNDWSGDEELGKNGNYQEVINNFATVYQERLAGMDGLIQAWKNE